LAAGKEAKFVHKSVFCCANHDNSKAMLSDQTVFIGFYAGYRNQLNILMYK